jgi:hypothetical protein
VQLGVPVGDLGRNDFRVHVALVRDVVSRYAIEHYMMVLLLLDNG